MLFRCNFIFGLEHDPILNHVMGDMPEKDSRHHLEALYSMAWKEVAPDPSRLELRLDATTTVGRMLQHGGGGDVFVRSTNGDTLDLVNSEGDALQLSSVPSLARGAKLRTTCGSGYAVGVDYPLECTPKQGTPLVGTMRADTSGSLMSVSVESAGSGFYASSTKCKVSIPLGVEAPAARCSVSPEVESGAVVALQLSGREVTVVQGLGEQLVTGGGNLPRGSFGFLVTRGWSARFSPQAWRRPLRPAACACLQPATCNLHSREHVLGAHTGPPHRDGAPPGVQPGLTRRDRAHRRAELLPAARARLGVWRGGVRPQQGQRRRGVQRQVHGQPVHNAQ